MNISFKQLEAFVWVADLGSFRKAAERLNTTQPNISIRISRLESSLNVSLMKRDAGSVHLTQKGLELLERARRVVSEADAFIEASGSDALVKGALRLGVTEMIVHTWLRGFMCKLKDKYPDLAVEFTVDHSGNLEHDLRDRSIDLAFQCGPFNRQMTGSVELGTYPLIWVASPAIGRSFGEHVSIHDLMRHPILTHALGTRPFELLAAHLREYPELKPHLVPSRNLSACLHMALCGMGLAILPRAMVEDELRSGELLQINYLWVPENQSFLARYDADNCPHFVATAAQLAGQVSSNHFSA